MTLPVITVYPDAIPAKGQAQTAFNTNVNDYLTWQVTFATQLTPWITYASNLGAALVAGNLPPLAGKQLDAVRVNAAGNGVEFADVTAAGWALLDDANAAAQRVTLGLVIGTNVSAPVDEITQLQAEDDASTVFGTVSGERLGQAIVANALPAPDYGTGNAALAAGAIGTYVFAHGTGDVTFGSTVAGSTLRPTSAARSVRSGAFTTATFDEGSTLAGTWRCMGTFDQTVTGPDVGSGNGPTILGATLWLRIS